MNEALKELEQIVNAWIRESQSEQAGISQSTSSGI
jgi:hypothetical protein